jgi:hypothetical protein
MSGFVLGKRSKSRLEGVKPWLIAVAERAINERTRLIELKQAKDTHESYATLRELCYPKRERLNQWHQQRVERSWLLPLQRPIVVGST